MAHVLIVESDCIVARNIAGALTRQGHSSVFTVDAQAAINAADARTPDIIILDLLLAGRSGIELLYELRSYCDWQNIPAIIYSNLKTSELPEICFEQLGIERVLHKPSTTISELTDEVTRLTATTPA